MRPRSSSRTFSVILTFWCGILTVFLSPAHARPASLLEKDPMALLGPHFASKIEWWYVTGFLNTSTGKRLGFQGTFFRFSTGFVHPAGLPPSPWEPKEINSFHGAISDLDSHRFVSEEFTRRAFDSLAGSHKHPFIVNVGQNTLSATVAAGFPGPLFKLSEHVKGQTLRLTLQPNTSPLWHDPSGILQTGDGKSDWAWYYSYPAMQVRGSWTLPGNHRARVTGSAWFDHEWTNSALGSDQIGWYWLWGTFNTKAGLKGFMAFQMIRKDGSPDRHRGGTVFLEEKGVIIPSYPRAKALRILSIRTRKKNGSCLPEKMEWSIEGLGTIRVRPYFDGQRLTGSTDYWEGAVRMILKGTNGESRGRGYLEVTGVMQKKNCPGGNH